jgi:hypothetical protein
MNVRITSSGRFAIFSRHVVEIYGVDRSQFHWGPYQLSGNFWKQCCDDTRSSSLPVTS